MQKAPRLEGRHRRLSAPDESRPSAARRRLTPGAVAALLLTAAAAVMAQSASSEAAPSDTAAAQAAPSAAAHPIVGEWRLINQATMLSIEFLADRTYRARTLRGSASGQWALVDDGHIATWTSEERPKRVNKFAVRGQHLVITDDDGVHHVHRRVSRLPENTAGN